MTELITVSDDPRIEQTYCCRAPMLLEPPDSTNFADLLKWAICVMEKDGTRLKFVSGAFAHCLKLGGLSNKQAAVVIKILASLKDGFYSSGLQVDEKMV